MVGKFRIAIIESPNPIDAFVGRTEATSLCATARLLEHEALPFTIHSKQDFRNMCAYLASADSQHCQYDAKPLVVHISAHGDGDGVAFGSDNISWEHLADELIPIFKNDFYDGRILISLSACGSGDQKIHRTLRAKLKKNTNKWPQYIFSILGNTVNWDDALVAWTVLYHKLSGEDALERDNVKEIFESIASCLGVRSNIADMTTRSVVSSIGLKCRNKTFGRSLALKLNRRYRNSIQIGQSWDRHPTMSSTIFYRCSLGKSPFDSSV